MTAPLTPAQRQMMDAHFGFLIGGNERRFVTVGMQMALPGHVPEATLLHCGGADPAPFWDARGLKGHVAEREVQKRHQRDEVEKAAARLFAPDGALRGELINGLVGDAVALLNQVFRGGDVMTECGLADKKVVLVLGFWRSMGTLMLWRSLRKLGIAPGGLSPFMIHDNMPDLGILEREPFWPGHIGAYFQFCQYLVWARQAFAGHPVVVQKNSAHAFWLQSLDSILGERAIYQFTIRHPVSSALSLFATFTEDVAGQAEDRTASSATEVWFRTVHRAFATPREEWDQLTLLEKAVENWAAYHVLIDLNGALARRLKVFRFGDDVEEFLDRTLPFTVPAPLDDDERAAPSRRAFNRHMTAAMQARCDAAIGRVNAYWQMFGVTLPKLELI